MTFAVKRLSGTSWILIDHGGHVNKTLKTAPAHDFEIPMLRSSFDCEPFAPSTRGDLPKYTGLLVRKRIAAVATLTPPQLFRLLTFLICLRISHPSLSTFLAPSFRSPHFACSHSWVSWPPPATIRILRPLGMVEIDKIDLQDVPPLLPHLCFAVFSF